IKNSFQIYAERSGLTAGIFYKGNLAGIAGFNGFDWKNKIGYIGYWLATTYQGHGIMTRSVRALTDYAFHELQLIRVDIRAAYDNERSPAIPKRLVFTEEGQLRQTEWLYDHYVDHLIYGILYIACKYTHNKILTSGSINVRIFILSREISTEIYIHFPMKYYFSARSYNSSK